MENTTRSMDFDTMYDLSASETARPGGLLLRVKQWLAEIEEERRELDFDVDPLLHFPRDI